MSMPAPELISVIIPFYKELDLIGRAVNSVLGQRLPPDKHLEIVIGNDSGMDEGEIRTRLDEAANRATRIVCNRFEKGAGNARNAAIEAAGGGVLAFLDADDFWHPWKLELQLPLLERGANFVCGGYQIERRHGVISPPAVLHSMPDFFKKLGVGTSTVALRRDFLDAERFRNFRFSQDTELWARLADKDGFSYAAVTRPVAVYSPSGRTANKLHQFQAFSTIVREFRLSGLQRANVYLRYAVRGAFNHYLRR